MTQKRSTRCIPLKNWPDASARHQIINQIIFEEYILGCQQKRADWASKARERLAYYGIDLAESTLHYYRREIKSGKRLALSSSTFGGKLYEELGSRVGKEGMYKQIDLLAHIFLCNPKYIGLPANQLIYMIQKYDGRVVACEWNRKMFEFMRNMKARFAPGSDAEVNYGNIFTYLEKTKNKFSLFDFDLMQHLYEDDIKQMANAIARTSEPVAVISVASCVGRARTEDEYREIMPSLLIEELAKCRCVTVEQYSDGYSDRVTPMRYELLVIECPHKMI